MAGRTGTASSISIRTCAIILHAHALCCTDLKALRSKGPVLSGRDASDNCMRHDLDQQMPPETFMGCAQIRTAVILGTQQSRLFWPKQTRGPVRLLSPSLAETSLKASNSAERRPCKPPSAEVSVSQQSLMPNDVDKRPPLFICILQLPWKVPELYNASIPKCFPPKPYTSSEHLPLSWLCTHAMQGYFKLAVASHVIHDA